jgi:hypothetical protein
MAASSGPKPEHIGWYKVYEWDSFADVGGFAYTVNNSSTAPNFSRIMYIMAMDDQHVSIEIDDFTSNTASRVGVPLSWTYEVNVNNMVVKYNKPNSFPGSNTSTQYNRINAVQGKINFWPSNYGTTGDNNSLYDSDDSGYGTSNGHGSFQFFDISVSPTQCIFAWNWWGAPGEGGMGNYSGTHPDWTFAQNFSSFSYLLGQVFVK